MDKSPDGSVVSYCPPNFISCAAELEFFLVSGRFFYADDRKQRFDAQVRPKGEKILAGQKNKEEKIL
jgi:hypothetical protein